VASYLDINRFNIYGVIGCETVRGQAKLMLGRLHYVRATAEEERRYVGQTIVTTDGHQVSEEGRHGSMIIQQGGIPQTNNSGMDIIASPNMSHDNEMNHRYVRNTN
jgi:hypothetical protein